MNQQLKNALADICDHVVANNRGSFDIAPSYIRAAKEALAEVRRALSDPPSNLEPLERAKPLPWHVVTVSRNANAFGHKGVLILNERGQSLELSLQAYGSDPLPKIGDVLEVLPRSEFHPQSLPGVTPERAKQIIASL